MIQFTQFIAYFLEWLESMWGIGVSYLNQQIWAFLFNFVQLLLDRGLTIADVIGQYQQVVQILVEFHYLSVYVDTGYLVNASVVSVINVGLLH